MCANTISPAASQEMTGRSAVRSFVSHLPLAVELGDIRTLETLKIRSWHCLTLILPLHQVLSHYIFGLDTPSRPRLPIKKGHESNDKVNGSQFF